MALDIIIVGCGIGGLAAAIALRRSGHHVTILEKYDSKAEVGFAISMVPNATRTLKYLDVDFEPIRFTPWSAWRFVRADRSPLEEILIDEKNKVLSKSKDYGAPAYSAHRVDLHEALKNHATRQEGEGPAAVIREGQTVTEYDPEAGTVTLHSGETLRADVIVAADGVKSKAHIPILGEERPAQLTNLSNVRFSLTTEQFNNIEGLRDIAGGSPATNIYTGPDQSIGLLRYPCRSGTLQNFGLFEWRDDIKSVEDKWRTQTNKSIALERLSGYADCVKEIVHQADEKEMYLWKIFDRMPLPSWSRGRMTLIGDAAHPMKPTLGQGGAQAIEDAAVLGAILKGVEDVGQVPKRLKVFEELRRPRASAVQLLSMSQSFAVSIDEDRKEEIRKYVQDEGLLEFTREGVNGFLFGVDVVAEAERVVKERFGSGGGVVGGGGDSGEKVDMVDSVHASEA